MDESTLTVLRIIKELQYDGRTDPHRQGIAVAPPIYLDPVPQIAIVAELGGTQPRIDVRRELRLLVADRYVDRVMHPWGKVQQYLRPDGKSVYIESEIDDKNALMTYTAWIPGEPVLCEVLEYGRYVLRATRDMQTLATVECYATTKPGRDRLAELAGEGKRKQKGPGWERLVIVKSNTGDDLARLDGKEYRLTGASDATFLELLQKKQGGPILTNTLQQSCEDRPARIYKRLPNAIQRIIDKPGQRTGKKGYRML
jgi:hypothetical protein